MFGNTDLPQPRPIVERRAPRDGTVERPAPRDGTVERPAPGARDDFSPPVERPAPGRVHHAAKSGPRQRSRAAQLETVQNALVRAGYYGRTTKAHEVDGKFGARTRAAVLRLQKDLKALGVLHGPLDGELSPRIAQALHRLEVLKGEGKVPPGRVSKRVATFADTAHGVPDRNAAFLRLPIEDRRRQWLQSHGLTLNQYTWRDDDVSSLVTRFIERYPATGDMKADLTGMARIIEHLKDKPDSADVIANRFGVDKLGFDPRYIGEKNVDALLVEIRRRALAAAARKG